MAEPTTLNTPQADAPTTPTSPKTTDPVRARRWVDRSISLAIAVLVIGLLELGSRLGYLSPIVIPPPSAIATALRDGFGSGVVWPHLSSTLTATAIGYGLAIAVGFTIGGLLAIFHRLERIFFPFIVAFQTLPKIAIAPLVIIWLGFGSTSKITIVAIVAFFPILVNTVQGLRLRERAHGELMRALGASKWQVFRYIRFPSALPYIFAGLHIGAILALIGTVAAEFVGAGEGLGVLLIQQKALFNVPAVYSVLVIFMVLGVTLHAVMRWIERRVTFWAQEDHLVLNG